MSEVLQPQLLARAYRTDPAIAEYDFYMVSTIAWDIQLGDHINTRKTKDVDIAIQVGDESQFFALKNALGIR